ncbi:MAG TPA: potassium-transporting ATPase subunit KdpC [Thermoanaerobaculia bacterium]|nr:potassium-transporting ATPase subunit KdpC [Thermoanaerobaculia bacterium]
MELKSHVYPAVLVTVLLTLLLGVAYPLAVTGLARLIFPQQAAGSLIEAGGRVVGSSLIGQPFAGRGYFFPRPSAAGNGYDPTASSGTNLGPTSKKLIEEQVAPAAGAARASRPAPAPPVPVDLVTSSGSGLDPHLSPAAADYQVPRVARERQMDEDLVRKLVHEHTLGRQWGVFGEPRVNVLELNRALDEVRPLPHSPAARPPR